MKITKRQLKRIIKEEKARLIKEEKARLLTEGAYLHEILDEAATSLEYRDGDAIQRLSYQVSDLMIDESEKSAYERALNAMAEAAYELESYEQGR